jgi:3-oxoacyl-[acyl-carrier protein] reductase
VGDDPERGSGVRTPASARLIDAVLVTGGSRGIGRAIALELGRAGADVVLSYRTGREEAEQVAAEIGGRAVEADVSDAASARALVEEAGELDVLVNNAGVTRDGVLARMSDDDWREVIDTNLSSVFYTCRAAARPMMKRRAGSIVNISSIVGVHGNFGQTNYAASKAGIIGFTKSLARELGSRNVRANVVAPGYVRSRLTDVLPEEATKAMLDATPLGRLGDAEDVAGAVRFLCADEARFVTGAVLLVDGGLGM